MLNFNDLKSKVQNIKDYNSKKALTDQLYSANNDPSKFQFINDAVDVIFEIEETTDQEFLKEIVSNEKSQVVKSAAIQKINDIDFLIDIALNDNGNHVRFNAVKKINDEPTLIKIFKNETNNYVRGEALKKIKDTDFLKEIALLENDPHTRRMALSLLRNTQYYKPLLMKALEDNIIHSDHQQKFIDDSEILKEIALNLELRSRNRIEAIKSISDPEVLKKIVLDVRMIENGNNPHNFKDVVCEALKSYLDIEKKKEFLNS